jgi:Uma2 family endonuclease
MDRVKPITGRPYLTAEEFERMGESVDPRELWDGTVMVHESAGSYGGAVGARLARLIGNHVDARSIGWTFDSSSGFQVGTNPDRVLSPDLAFIRRERIASLARRGFYKLVPDFVAEVRSPSQTWVYTLERGGIWIAHGACVVWLIDPETRRACEFRPMAGPVEVGPDGVLSADPAIEAFSVSMRDVFAGLD